ncbi:unnamed protein product, partial [Pelagomonas calceolata]
GGRRGGRRGDAVLGELLEAVDVVGDGRRRVVIVGLDRGFGRGGRGVVIVVVDGRGRVLVHAGLGRDALVAVIHVGRAALGHERAVGLEDLALHEDLQGLLEQHRDSHGPVHEIAPRHQSKELQDLRPADLLELDAPFVAHPLAHAPCKHLEVPRVLDDAARAVRAHVRREDLALARR